MKIRLSILFAGICGIILAWVNPLYAFMGDYNSATGNDMAVIGGLKSTEIEYEDDDGDGDRDIERQVLFVGVSKAMNTKLKAFGGLNYVLDGDIDDSDFEQDSGYSLTGGADYIFLNKSDFSVSGFGQLDYILDDWEDDGDSFSIKGYELSGGAMGKYNFMPNLSAFALIKIELISGLTGEVDGGDEEDIERDKMFGLQTGVIYDVGPWFVKGSLYLNMESGFGISGGMKF